MNIALNISHIDFECTTVKKVQNDYCISFGLRKECEIGLGCFSPAFIKIDVTFEPDHQIKSFTVLLEANKKHFN